MPPMKPGTRAYREAMRALRDASDTSDRVGLYVPGDKPARETLVPLGGRMSARTGTRAFREAFSRVASEPPTTPLTVNELPFDGYVFDTTGQTSGIATITGTAEPDTAIQVRAASAGGSLGWQAVTSASDGTWTAMLPFSNETDMGRWYVPEVRYSGFPATAVSGTNTFSCGDVIGVMGQSELVYWLNNTAFYNNNLVRALDAENLTVVLDNADTGVSITTSRVTPGTVSTANAGSIALANLLHRVRPGRKLMIVDMAQPGTSAKALADDSDVSPQARDWAPLETIVDLVRSGGSDVGAFILNWCNATAVTLPTMHESWAPFLFGQTSAGATFTLGSTHDGPSWASPVDHCLYDLDAAPDARGRGLFARAKTKLLLMQPLPFFGSDDTEDPAFDETLVVTNAARAGVLNLAASSQFQAVGRLLPSTHLADFGGGIHPLEDDAFGTPLFAMQHAPAFLSQAGVTVNEPLLIDAVAIDANTIEMTVDLPNGGTLTTIRALESIADPVTPPPHYQDVVGFQVNRIGGSKRPVYPLSETSYPAEFRGTVTITDSGTGTAPNRTGKVRIVLETEIFEGDLVTYLDGQATAVLSETRDVAAKLFLNMLIEHVPAWYDADAEYPFHGVPVRPQTPTPALEGASPVAFATKSSTSDAYLTGPVIPGGVSGITIELDAAISLGAAPVELFEYVSTTFQARLDARSGKRGLVLMVERSDGVAVFSFVTTADGVMPVDERATLLVTSTLDRGDGVAELGVYVNGVLQGSVYTAANAGSTTFATNRALELLRDTGTTQQLYGLRVWHGYTADGTTAGLGTPVHEVSGAAANWNAPGTGLTKAGTDSFT